MCCKPKPSRLKFKKGFTYFMLCATNLRTMKVSPFEVNYSYIFPQYKHYLRCTDRWVQGSGGTTLGISSEPFLVRNSNGQADGWGQAAVTVDYDDVVVFNKSKEKVKGAWRGGGMHQSGGIKGSRNKSEYSGRWTGEDASFRDNKGGWVQMLRVNNST